jgi:hypothetical protein
MLICMRTTLNIDDELMLRVKKLAAESGKTITEIVQDALMKATVGEIPKKSQFTLNWRTVCGRVRPGVDLADRDSLYEVMEHPR